jgi:hypothetical protein
MVSAYDPAFDRLVMAGPIVDNASARLYAIGELEGDRCPCGTAIPGDVDGCDECAGEPHTYPCPTCGGNGCPSCADTGERIEYAR